MEKCAASVKPVVSDKAAFCLLIFFTFVVTGATVLNHYFFRSYAFDFAVYNFAFFDYAHFNISPCPVYLFTYNVTFLQDHFSLTLMILSPLYWLLSGLTGTYTLLILQGIIVSAGGWASYRLILFKTENRKLALLVLLYYFILLGRLTAVAADCNLAIIGSAVVPVFLYYFEKNKIVPAIVCFLFLIFNREDFCLWLIFICAFLMLWHRKEKVKLKFSTLLFFLSVLLSVLIFKFFIPSLEDENKKYSLFNFAALGATAPDALLFMLKHPLEALKLLFVNHSGSNYYDGIKSEFYIVLLLSGGVVLFLRPLFLIPFLPLIAKKMYNDEPIRWGIESYYSVEVISILPVLVFLIIAGLKNEKLKLVLASLVCVSTLFMTLTKLTRPSEDHIALLGDVQKTNILSADFFHSYYDVDEIYETMRLVPDSAIVSASGKLSSHLAFRKRLYFFPRIDNADYILLLKKNDNWPISQERADTTVSYLLKYNWEVMSEKKDIICLRNTHIIKQDVSN
ncbi:MAG TPA: DUF2079 domain-containing protein [Bacteroidia bacterium]|nr:DUF2079 domain-containing protein [Bacteroidia bacterium]